MPSASSELASHSAGVLATPKRLLRYLGYPLQPFVTGSTLSHILLYSQSILYIFFNNLTFLQLFYAQAFATMTDSGLLAAA